MSAKTKMRIKKNDKVIVVTGKDKGKVAEVTKVIPQKNRVIVAGINMVSKHQRPNAQNQKGSIIRKEASLDYSNVMIYSEKESKGVRLGIKEKKDKKVVRVCRKTGEEF
ncbi:50S ribosomal protein L24 [PVC group bacterium (ex Bugula neritina AB1)]|nr:50S ribosomal protein L24 [PVC group bacterium (ex Bugula neritina AB1)]